MVATSGQTVMPHDEAAVLMGELCRAADAARPAHVTEESPGQYMTWRRFAWHTVRIDMICMYEQNGWAVVAIASPDGRVQNHLELTPAAVAAAVAAIPPAPALTDMERAQAQFWATPLPDANGIG